MIGAIVAGGLSAMAPPVTNSYESIATTVVGAGGASDVTFNLSGVTGFKHLQIRGLVTYAASANAVCLFANGDTGSNYAWHQLYGTGSGTPGASASASTNIPNIAVVPSSGYPASFVADVLDYNSSSKYKTYRTLSGYDASGSGLSVLRSTLWMNTAAITSLTIKFDAGTLAQYSSFALYGIKG
jgi:hypothetical protein